MTPIIPTPINKPFAISGTSGPKIEKPVQAERLMRKITNKINLFFMLFTGEILNWKYLKEKTSKYFTYPGGIVII
ncbi:MAG: hypothetical protein ACFFCV_03515 [Promethearchaeota archaeon]